MNQGLPTARAMPGVRPNRISSVVDGLTVQRDVETFLLDLRLHPQADEHVDQLEDDQGDDGVVAFSPATTKG